MSRPVLEEVLTCVEPSNDHEVVALRSSLASWLREYADRAERGELVAVAIAPVKLCGVTSSAWHDDVGQGVTLIGSLHCLAHRMQAHLVGGEGG